MSLNKSIQHGKEHRKPYRGAKAVDPWCRNHVKCAACRMALRYKQKRREPVQGNPHRVESGDCGLQ